MPSINIEYRFIPWESKILPSSMSQFNTEIIRRVTDTEIARMYGKHELQKLDALKISRDAQMHVFAHSVPSLMVKQRNKIFPCLHPSQVKEPALSEDLFVWIEALLWNLITTMEFDSPCRGMDAKRFCSLVRDVGKLFTKYVKEIMPEVVNEKLGKGFVYHDMICSTRKFQKSMEGNSLRGLKRQTILSRCSDLIILVHLARASWHICDHFQHTDKTEHVNRISDHPIAKKSSTFRKKKQICFSYVRKKCRFGINCTKKHVRKEVLKEIKCPHVLKENKCKYGGACLYDHSFKIWRRKKAVQPYQLHANAKQAAEERMAEDGLTVLQPSPSLPPPIPLLTKDLPIPKPPELSIEYLFENVHPTPRAQPPASAPPKIAKIDQLDMDLSEEIAASYLTQAKVKSLIEELNRVNGNVDELNEPADQLFLKTQQLDQFGLQILNHSFSYHKKHIRMIQKDGLQYYLEKRYGAYNFLVSMVKIRNFQRIQNAHLHGGDVTLVFWNALKETGILNQVKDPKDTKKLVIALKKFYFPDDWANQDI